MKNSKRMHSSSHQMQMKPTNMLDKTESEATQLAVRKYLADNFSNVSFREETRNSWKEPGQINKDRYLWKKFDAVGVDDSSPSAVGIKDTVVSAPVVKPSEPIAPSVVSETPTNPIKVVPEVFAPTATVPTATSPVAAKSLEPVAAPAVSEKSETPIKVVQEVSTPAVTEPTSTASVATPPPTVTMAAQAPVAQLAATFKSTSIDQFIGSKVPVGANVKVVASLAEAKSLVAANSGLKYVVVSDGEHHALFQKGLTSGDTTTNWSGSSWGAKFTDYVPLVAFAGGSDVTAAFSSAIKVASKLGLGIEFPNDHQYTMSSTIDILPGTAYVHGNGSTLVYKNIGSEGGIHLFPDKNKQSVSNFEISGLTIDQKGLNGAYGIYGKNVQGAHIHDMEFKNVGNGYAVLLRGEIKGADDVVGNVIENNRISAVTSNFAYGVNTLPAISIDSRVSQGVYTSDVNHYRNTGTNPDSTFNVSNNVIKNNHIDGGYYGINLAGATNTEITGNVITNNMRSISLQVSAHNNKITNNILSDSLSSGVHIAYNSNDNMVSGNTIQTSKAGGQGLLQAYTGSSGNQFLNNNIDVVGQARPKWLLYVGPDSSNTVFNGNTVTGAADRAVVGVESVWDARKEATTKMYAYGAKDSRTTLTGFGHGELSNVEIKDNIFVPNLAKNPILFASADATRSITDSKNIIAHVSDINFSNNTVIGSKYSELVTIRNNDGATVKGLTQVGNKLHDGSVNHFVGSSADDTYFVDHVGDKITEKAWAGYDHVYSTVNHTLSAYMERLTLLGSDTINGTGNASGNIIMGNTGDTVLIGMGGNDRLDGNLGNNTLTGGEGRDRFVFSHALNGDIDKITDFTSSEDKIALSKVIFGDLKASNDWFAESADITDTTRIVYNESNGLLSYDSDGKGGAAAIDFASLSTGLTLDESKFEIF